MKYFKRIKKYIKRNKPLLCNLASITLTMCAFSNYLIYRTIDKSLIFLLLSEIFSDKADNEIRFRKLEKESE